MGKKLTAISISGAILAGGKNTRMGSINKAFLKLDNIPLIEKNYKAVCKEHTWDKRCEMLLRIIATDE